MSRIAYVDGRYVPHREASVHVEDRGYQFADGVYEVCEVRAGRLIDERRHMERLQRSLRELRMPMPMPLTSLGVVLRETVRRNRVRDGIVYLQVTRGVAPRDFAFPQSETRPVMVVTSRSHAFALRSTSLGDSPFGGRKSSPRASFSRMTLPNFFLRPSMVSPSQSPQSISIRRGSRGASGAPSSAAVCTQRLSGLVTTRMPRQVWGKEGTAAPGRTSTSVLP